MSMGTRAGAVPANLIVPEIAPVLAGSIAIAAAPRDDWREPCGDLGLLHPAGNTTSNAKRIGVLSLSVIQKGYAATVALMAAITASANSVVEAVPPTSRVR